MKSRFFFVVCAAVIVFGATTAWANDQIRSTVTIPAGQPSAVVVNNGVPSGTIQLYYNVVGYAFPCGQFAQYNLALLDVSGTGQTPSYPVELDLFQTGKGTAVSQSASTPTFSVNAVSWTGSSTVNVSINCSNLDAPYDGQEIVGNLNEATNPQGAHLGTISSIQVHITLVYPTTCMKLYSFEANQDTGVLVDNVVVNVNNNNNKVTSTNPGQLSIDGLVVNTCAQPISFDMSIGLDTAWRMNPNNNPGNATFVYTYAGVVSPSTYSLAAFGAGTNQGETLCIKGLTLNNGDSLLTRVHAQIKSGMLATALPTGGNFNFSATLFTEGTGCTAGTLLPNVGVTNPATSTVGFTVQ